MSRQLLRVCRSYPLTRLRQGGILSIESSFPKTFLKIQPEWREDGRLELEQWLPVGDAEAEMTVKHEQDTVTSLGRSESHVSVRLCPPPKSKHSPSNAGPDNHSTNVSKSASASVKNDKIITDDGTILPDSDKWHDDKFRRVEYSDGITHVTSTNKETPPTDGPSMTLTATVPEKINLACRLESGGDIFIDKKVEGDVDLYTENGDIRVQKLRGHILRLSAEQPQNTIYSSDLLEAESLNVSTRGRLRAKKVHGSDIHIRVERGEESGSETVPQDEDDEGSLIDIGSLYASRTGGADISVSSSVKQRAVRIKSHHGHVTIEAAAPFPSIDGETAEMPDPIVELGGVNGSFNVLVKAADSSTLSLPTNLAARIHVDTLSPDSINAVTSDRGDIALTLDRKLEADMRLLSTKGADSTDVCNALIEDDDPTVLEKTLRALDESASGDPLSKDRISIKTNAFTLRHQDEPFHNIQYLDGWVENKSSEPDSRFDLKSKGGKIRLDSAASQALAGFVPCKENPDSDVIRPLVAATTSGQITLESLSWFGAIARRYGIEEEGKSAGRTASRAGRELKPTNSK